MTGGTLDDLGSHLTPNTHLHMEIKQWTTANGFNMAM